MSGFAIREAPAEAVHDPLFARALALDDGSTRVCLLVLDLIGVDESLTTAIRRAASELSGIPAAHVAVAATHTHGGPAVLKDAWLGRPDAAYLQRVVQASAAAVAAAITDLAPATVRHAIGAQVTIARNRRVPDGPIDPDVPVVRFDRAGAPVALLVSYACHPVTLGPDNLAITRDYPGVVVDELERRYPGSLVVFATGCCGQVNTGHLASDSMRGFRAPQRTFERARAIGLSLAEAAANAIEAAAERPPLRGPLRIASARVALEYAPGSRNPQLDLAEWRRELAELAADDAARAATLRVLIRWAEARANPPPRACEVEAMCIGLGDACIALYPGEVFVEFGLSAKDAIADRSVITLAFSGSAPGYLPHRSAYDNGGYEVEEAYRYYGQPGPFPAEAGERLHEVVVGLARQVLS